MDGGGSIEGSGSGVSVGSGSTGVAVDEVLGDCSVGPGEVDWAADVDDGLGDGGAFRSPMAVALIGGLLASTFLSLVFVPAAFTIMDDFGRLLDSKLSRFIGPKDDIKLLGNSQV